MFARMFGHFRSMGAPFAVAAALFAAGIWFGAVSDAFQELLQEQLDALGAAAQTLGSMENAHFWTGVFIFFNNTVKSIIVMYLGLFFGIVPILFLLLNGMVIGYLLSVLDQQGVQVAEIVVKGLLPHGILEIPAIVLACGYGLKLGWSVWSAMIGRAEGKVQLKQTMLASLPLMLFLTAVLLVAAIIESTVTVWLLGG